MATKLKVGIIGMGTMGRCVATGLLDAQKLTKDQIGYTTRQRASAERVQEELGIAPCGSNAELVAIAETVLLAVKPQNLADVLQEIAPQVRPEQTLISIVASYSTQSLEHALGGKVPVLRAMPNTPALVRQGITAVCSGVSVVDRDWQRCESIFEALGKVIRIEEKHMDAVTGLSGCGPAFIYVILESLTDAGIKVGLARDVATELASHTMLGAVRMLIETGRHPASLKDDVTTPAGCTIDGLMELEEGRLRVTLIKAVVQATRRAASLKGSLLGE